MSDNELNFTQNHTTAASFDTLRSKLIIFNPRHFKEVKLVRFAIQELILFKS